MYFSVFLKGEPLLAKLHCTHTIFIQNNNYVLCFLYFIYTYENTENNYYCVANNVLNKCLLTYFFKINHFSESYMSTMKMLKLL